MSLFRSKGAAKDLPFNATSAGDAVDVRETADDHLLRVTPYQDGGSIDKATEWLEAIHPQNADIGGRRSVPRAFEIYFDGTQIHFQHAPKGSFSWYQKRLRTKYPNSTFEQRTPDFMDITDESYIAGGTLGLEKHRFWPIRRRDLEGFREDDPYEAVLTDIVDDPRETDPLDRAGNDPASNMGATRAPVKTVIQLMFRPTQRKNWTNTKLMTTNLKELWYQLPINEIYSLHALASWHREKDHGDAREIANALDRRARESAFDVKIRHLSVGDDPEAVEVRSSAVASSFSSYYNSKTGQSFKMEPAKKPARLAKTMCARTWKGAGSSLVLTAPELAPVLHTPAKDIQISEIEYATTGDTGEAPVEAPDFEDFDETGFFS